MGLLSEITERLKALRDNRNRIRTQLIDWGLNVTQVDTLDQLTTELETISKYSGGVQQVEAGTPYTVPKGYYDGTMSIEAIGYEAKLDKLVITPSKAKQTLLPPDGFAGYSEVICEPIPDDYVYGPDIEARLAAL